MKKTFSSATPINYMELGFPIPSGTVSSAFALVQMQETQYINDFTLLIHQRFEIVTPDPIWKWNDIGKLQDPSTLIEEIDEQSWEQITNEVLLNRAKTWEELAGL